MKNVAKTVPYLLVVTLFSVILYPKFPLFFLPGITVAVRLEDVVISVTLIVWLISHAQQLNTFVKDPVFRSIGLFFLVTLVSVFSGAYLTQTLTLTTGLLHWGRRLEYIALFFVAATSIKSKKDFMFVFKALLVISIYIFLYGVGQKYFNLPVVTTQNKEYAKGLALFYLPGGHLVSTFAGHYDMASVLILFSPFLYLMLFATKKTLQNIFVLKNEWITRALLIAIITSGLWLLVQAASRISIVSYMLVATASLIFIKKYKYIPVVIISILLFINLSSNLITRYMSIFNVAVQKVISLEDSLIAVHAQTEEEPQLVEDRSTSIRLNVEWPRALRALQKNPALGTGYSSITLATDNDYLRALGETGILGTVSLFLIFGNLVHALLSSIVNIKRNTIYKIFLLGAIALMPGVMLNMVFIDILEASKFAIVFWILLGVAYSASLKYHEK